MASRAVFNEIGIILSMREKHQPLNREYKRTPHREHPGNRLGPPPPKTNFERTPRAPHCTDRAQTSTTGTGRPSPSTSLPFVRTVRARRDMSKNRPKIHRYRYAYVCVLKIVFFQEYRTFLFRPRVFPSVLGCGARREPASTPRCKCGSRPGSVSRALGVQRSRNLARNHGIAFRPARANQACANPLHIIFSLFFTFLLLFLK